MAATFTVRFPSDRVDACATKLGITRAAFVKALLDQGCADVEREGRQPARVPTGPTAGRLPRRVPSTLSRSNVTPIPKGK